MNDVQRVCVSVPEQEEGGLEKGRKGDSRGTK